MKIFIQDIPIIILSDQEFIKTSNYDHIYDGDHWDIRVEELTGEVLIRNADSSVIDRFLVILKQNSLKKLEEITFTVHDYRQVIDDIKMDYTIIKAAVKIDRCRIVSEHICRIVREVTAVHVDRPGIESLEEPVIEVATVDIDRAGITSDHCRFEAPSSVRVDRRGIVSDDVLRIERSVQDSHHTGVEGVDAGYVISLRDVHVDGRRRVGVVAADHANVLPRLRDRRVVVDHLLRPRVRWSDRDGADNPYQNGKAVKSCHDGLRDPTS